jgi:hypothetical protein
MRLGRRVREIEEELRSRRPSRVVVVDDGSERSRQMIEEARMRGCQVDMIVLGVMHVAETMEEAQAILEEHKAKRTCPLTVYKEGPKPWEVLLEWDEGIPT